MAQHEHEYVSFLRPKRHTNTYLANALGDRMSHEPVNAYRRQQQREQPEHAHKRSNHSLPGERHT